MLDTRQINQGVKLAVKQIITAVKALFITAGVNGEEGS